MKKINKFLALGLAGASALAGGFMLTGCDVTDDKDKTQTEQNQDEQKVVSSISLNADTLPSYIIKDKFARTNITMTVIYEDNTTKVIDVTESMFSETDKEKLKNVGQYNLTVNYGGKTATMYANVVDERYLLKEVVEANLDKDVTLSVGNNTCQIDADNKIIKYTDVDDGWAGYTWLSNNVTYNYEPEDGCNKTLASNWEEESYYYHTMDILDILENGVDSYGEVWTIESVEKDGINYVLTAKYEGQDYTLTQKYIFNDDFLWKIEYEDSDPETWEYNFNYAPITLSVPSEIKALEDSATINVESRIADLCSTMEDYLESDFEVNVNAYGNYSAEYKFDTEKQILYVADSESSYLWFWTNEDNFYKVEHETTDQIWKFNEDEWKENIKEVCFMLDVLNDNDVQFAIDVSKDGQYYELLITAKDDYVGEDADQAYKFIFNNNELARIEISNNGELLGCYTFNKTNVNLEVPAEIKALESSAQ